MQRWGAWRPIGRLGSGGMGEVWAVEHVHARVPGALKRPVAMTAALVDTLSHELRMVASLDHPGVVEVLDHGADPEPWVVFERVDGGPLELPASFGELRGILVDVLDALAHAHARGVLHRDLKPANLLRGRDGRVRLADFGIARARDAAVDEGADPTGTLAFMAPEQILGASRDQGPPTDLYALACTAWLLCTGLPPFLDDPLSGHLGRVPPALEPRFPVPDGFEGWLLRALAKSPHDRFRSAAEAAWALTRFAEVGGRADAAPLQPLPATITLAIEPRNEAAPVFRSRRELAPVEVPPLPHDWREGQRPPRFLGVSLALVGVRPPAVVGRQREQDLLWAAARQPGVRAVLVTGPEGSGRSRLVAWVADRLDECGALVARTDASRGVVGWIEALTGADRFWSLEQVQERIASRAPTLDPTTVGSLARTMVAGDAGARPTPGPLIRLVEALACGRPTALCWDEPGVVGARWIAALLGSGLRALLVGAGEAPGLEGVPRIELGPLPDDARRSLVRELLDADEGLAALLDARTGGHPLFAVQLALTLAARGALVPGPRGLRLRDGAIVDEVRDLADAWKGRIDPLAVEVDDERTLVLAALLGHRIDPGELGEATRRAGLPEPAPLLARAREAGVVRSHDGLWRWDHALLREHVASRRQADHPGLHAAAAEALVGMGASEDRVAHHLLGAGRVQEALPWLERAALAAGRGVDQGRALALCETWAAAMDRVGIDRWDPRRAPLVRRRIGVETDAGRPESALGLVDEVLASVVGWPPDRVGELHLLRANVLELVGRPTEALAACDRAVEACGDLEPRLSLTRGGILVHTGRPEEALAAAARGLDVASDPYVRGELLRMRAGAAMRLGRLEVSAAAFAEAEEAYLRAGATRSAAMVRAESACVHHVRGDWLRAEEGYRGSLAQLDDPGDPASWNAMINLATVLVRSGRPSEASTWLERALPRVRAAGYRNPELFALVARWATLEGGPAWDADADAVEALQAGSGIEDPDLEALARIAAARVEGDPERAARALAFAEARRAALS